MDESIDGAAEGVSDFPRGGRFLERGGEGVFVEPVRVGPVDAQLDGAGQGREVRLCDCQAGVGAGRGLHWGGDAAGVDVDDEGCARVEVGECFGVDEVGGAEEGDGLPFSGEGVEGDDWGGGEGVVVDHRSEFGGEVEEGEGGWLWGVGVWW